MCRSTNTVPHVITISHHNNNQATAFTRLSPLPLPLPLSINNNNNNNRRPPIIIKKSVRFAIDDDNELDQIRYFERISFIDAKNVWYNESELDSFVQEGKKLALAYRNLTSSTNTTTNLTTTNTNTTKTTNDLEHHQNQDYRGFDSYTIKRQKHRLLSNRFNVLIQHHQKDTINMNDDSNDTDTDTQELDEMSKRCSNWSTNVALLTAINDYFESYGGDCNCNGDHDDDDDDESIVVGLQQSFFPSVTDMIPPEFPITIQRIMLSSSAIVQRKRTRSNFVQQQQQQQQPSTDNVSSSNNSSDVIRRVKQRVVY
jgi:hypothetical protein